MSLLPTGRAPVGKAIRPIPGFRLGHPGFAESLIPVWGSAREALADAEDGDAVGAAVNGTLAASDLFLAGDVAKAVGKGGLYAVRGAIGEPAYKAEWKYVRKMMGGTANKKAGGIRMLEKHQHGHHWLIPQKAKGVPAAMRNHPLNIKAMPSREIHMRVHQKYGGKPRYGLLGQFWHGLPHWSKVAGVAAPGHPLAAATARRSRR